MCIDIIICAIEYLFLGAIIFCGVASSFTDTGFQVEIANPLWWYRNYKLNWFGAFIVGLFFTLVCLPISLGYWIYKIFTVGRK